ncbi:hypothetical protein ACS0TY_014985 [Phlomoides rotata]
MAVDMATRCYEHACTKYPNNLELMMGLFNCYVREYSFVICQAATGLKDIAIKMYKTAGEERFSLWAVCSIQLQVCCGNGGDKLFLLAEGLLKKHIASHGLHEPEALSVYVSLLEQQRKYSDALEILSGNLGSLMMIEVDKLRLHGRLLARAGDYGAAADVFQKVLEHCQGDMAIELNFCLLKVDVVEILCVLFISPVLIMLLADQTGSVFFISLAVCWRMTLSWSKILILFTHFDCKKLRITDEHFDSRM